MLALGRIVAATAVAAIVAIGVPAAQTHGEPVEFSATAIANDELGAGAGRVIIRVNRWSTESERTRLVETLKQDGAGALLDELQDMRPVGTIRTPDSLAYDLRYAHERRGEDGQRQIVIATDRPLSFWEQFNSSRTLDYPFTVIQMQFDGDGRGKGTMSYATKISAYGTVIELENFTTAPIMLTNIETRPVRDE